MQKTQSTSKRGVFAYLLIVILLIAAVYGNIHFENSISAPIRALYILGVVLLIVSLLNITHSGRQLFSFLKASRGELRKITWPTRDMLGKMVLFVSIAVVLMILILWGIDTLFAFIINLLI